MPTGFRVCGVSRRNIHRAFSRDWTLNERCSHLRAKQAGGERAQGARAESCGPQLPLGSIASPSGKGVGAGDSGLRVREGPSWGGHHGSPIRAGERAQGARAESCGPPLPSGSIASSSGKGVGVGDSGLSRRARRRRQRHRYLRARGCRRRFEGEQFALWSVFDRDVARAPHGRAVR